MPRALAFCTSNESTCVQDLIAAQAVKHPQRVAVQEDHQKLTFSELERRATSLAHVIRANPIRQDQPIAILLPASIGLIVAELAILKAGAAFLPIDPSYPSERLELILRDAEVDTVITHRSLLGSIPVLGLRVIDVDEPVPANAEPLPAADPASLAYVIFTSGSTGRPKGVMVEHRNLTNLISHFEFSLELTEKDRSAVTASPAFDASIAEVWPYLAVGASVHVTPAGLKFDTALLLQWLKQEKITVALLPTALVELLIERDNLHLPDLRVLITGGEQLHKLPPRQLPFRFLNAYGPTECTVIASWAEIEPEPATRRPPAIGRAIAGVFIRVLDDQMRVVEEGVPGEIYIGGAGVARGYLNRPDLTTARFVPDPFDHTGTGRLYRTGDRACWRRGGDLAFLGRTDRQVQLRGFRIEPDEIEFVLKQDRSIDDAAVVLQQDSQITRLVAFLATSLLDREGVIRAVKERIKHALPAHMHPAIYVIMERFPMTAHGKIDYAQLTLPPRPVETVVEDHGSDAEHTVRSLWSSILGADALLQSEHFFEAGGDSLAMIAMLRQLEERFGIHLPTATFLRSPTLRHCVDLLQGGGKSDLPLCVILLPTAAKQTESEPFFLVGGAGGGAHRFEALARASALRRPFYFLEAQALPHSLLTDFSIQGTARYFLSVVRRIQPSGPYRLGGYSLGGLVAIEIAHALLELGEEVKPLILIDTYAEAANPSTSQRFRFLAHRLLTAPAADSKAFLKDRISRRLQRVRLPTQELTDFVGIEASQNNQVLAALQYMENGLVQCRIPLRVLISQYGSKFAPSAKDRGWSRFASAGLEIHEVPGDHFSILESPYCEVLGAHLNQILT